MAEETTDYPAGTPIWTDLQTTDVDAARTFYQELFGWTCDDPAPPEYGGYAMLRRGDLRRRRKHFKANRRKPLTQPIDDNFQQRFIAEIPKSIVSREQHATHHCAARAIGNRR